MLIEAELTRQKSCGCLMVEFGMRREAKHEKTERYRERWRDGKKERERWMNE